MKKAIIILVISFGVTKAFAQTGSLKLDNSGKKYSFEKNLKNAQKPSFNIFKQNENTLLFQKDSTISHSGLMKDETWEYDHMPCFVPKGNYPIQKIAPDSTLSYSMLVKKL
jgi:hypothetical protein